MKDILIKLKLFYYATNIPVRLYDTGNRPIRAELFESRNTPAFFPFARYEKKLLNLTGNTIYYTNEFNEHYYSFGFEHDNKAYKLITGPTIDNLPDKKVLLKTAGDNNVKLSDYDSLEAYFRSLPRYTSASLRSTEPLLRYLLCGSEPDLSGIMKRNRLPEELEEKKLQVNEAQRYHHSLKKDSLIFEAVRKGEREELFTLLYTPGDGPQGILCRNDPVRSYKNLFIVTVSHTTRAAIEGGVDSESAYNLSDTLIQAVEEINLYEEITELFIKMFNAFLELVEKAKKRRYTAPVYSAIDYISKHYYESISVKELAGKLHLSGSRLLKLFRSQTGTSVKEFIIDRRISEAEKLLKFTDRSIVEICEMTGFTDQSYMTNIFRKKRKITPKKFREVL